MKSGGRSFHEEKRYGFPSSNNIEENINEDMCHLQYNIFSHTGTKTSASRSDALDLL